MKLKHIIYAALFGVFLFSATIHARMFSNSTDGAFDGDGNGSTGDVTLACSYTIEELVIKGAEYYFRAHADIDRLSGNVEISDLYGVDFYTIWWTVKSALDNMNMARYYYQELQYKANQTPYNKIVINKLMNFDYDSFQEQNSLIKEVFSEVKGYLVNGNVRGVYSRTSVYFNTLINILETIKWELYAGKVPANDNMWNLNHTCAKVHMFGQYIARIFETIK
jgi:hypothetical protein